MASWSIVPAYAVLAVLCAALQGVPPTLAAPAHGLEANVLVKVPSGAPGPPSPLGAASLVHSDGFRRELGHARRRHRRSSGRRHQGDAGVLRGLLIGRRPHQDADDAIDFGGLELRDLRGDGTAALVRDAVLLPILEYDDYADDGAEDALLGAILNVPRRSRCPSGERFYKRLCRPVWP